jgi:hypothetical protein
MEKNMNNFWLNLKDPCIPQGVQTNQDDVGEMMEAYRSQCDEEYVAKAQLLEDEYNAKLEEAYACLSEELKIAEETALKGYQEAWNELEKLRAVTKQLLEELAAEKKRKCPDCGYRPGERGKGLKGGPPDDAWGLDV